MATKKEIGAANKKKLVLRSYAALVQGLPINDILYPLVPKRVLTPTAVSTILKMPDSQSKTMYFLDEYILRSLKVGIDYYFDSLVEVLLKSEDYVAKNLGENLQSGNYVESVRRPAVKYGKWPLL